MKLTGTILKNDQSIKTNGDDKNSKKRRKRELTLTVTKTLNRFLTKKRKLKRILKLKSNKNGTLIEL